MVGSWSDLNAWLIPTSAEAEWLTLSALLAELPEGQVPCRADPEPWWPDRKHLNSPMTNVAVLACERCPARDACLAYAVAAGEREGVWGGMLPAERQTLGRAAAA